MSGTYESIDANPSDSRNAQIAAAGAPRRARKVPGAMMPRSPTRAITSPIAAAAADAADRPSTPVRNSAVPTIRTRARKIGAGAASGSASSRSTG